MNRSGFLKRMLAMPAALLVGKLSEPAPTPVAAPNGPMYWGFDPGVGEDHACLVIARYETGIWYVEKCEYLT